MDDSVILELTEPLERMYEDVSGELIVQIAKHLKGGSVDEPTLWKIAKLSEMGKLNAEAIGIISKYTKKKDELIRDAIGKALGITAEEVDGYIAGAKASGYISTTAESWQTSERMRNIVEEYIAQAERDTNLVNTVMLDSTMTVYKNAVLRMDEETRQYIEKVTSSKSEAELGKQLGKSQRILNAAAGETVTGATARDKARNYAVRKMAKEGITGYVDIAGHKWSPEAYVNMDIRTTVHNTAVNAQRERTAEWGITTFQISSKSSARPLCYPYQGWICSWDGSAGTVYDIDGNPYKVHPISDTSYGDPAGIFGINCGHFPETFVSGYSTPRYEQTNEVINESEYKASQVQRSLEREIRAEKTLAVAQSSAGDSAGVAETKAKVREMTKAYREWCDINGRTARTDRLDVVQYQFLKK